MGLSHFLPMCFTKKSMDDAVHSPSPSPNPSKQRSKKKKGQEDLDLSMSKPKGPDPTPASEQTKIPALELNFFRFKDTSLVFIGLRYFKDFCEENKIVFKLKPAYTNFLVTVEPVLGVSRGCGHFRPSVKFSKRATIETSDRHTKRSVGTSAFQTRTSTVFSTSTKRSS
jgi:hypothetical protein